MTELNELVEDAISGNKDSFEKALKLVLPYLKRFAATKIKNPDDIDDVIQNTTIKAYKYISNLKSPEYFKTWIIKILINECNLYYNNLTPEYELIDNIDYSESYDDNGNDITDNIDFERLIQDLNNDEKEILKLYYKDDYTPTEISKILNMNINTVKSKITRSHKKLRKIIPLAIILICVVTISSAIAIHLIKKIFNNSHAGIDTAVKNGYVQNVDMDYIYYNDLGVKVDYLLVDDQNIDISFVYNYKGTLDSDLKEVNMIDYTITDEDGNMIYSSNPIERPIYYSSLNDADFLVIDKSTIKNSLLITSDSTVHNFKTLYFNIFKIRIITNNSSTVVSGNWIFNISLDTKFVERTSYSYEVSDSEYVSNVKTKLTATSLEIELELTDKFDYNILQKPNSIILLNQNNKSYELIEAHITKEGNMIILFPITLYDNENLLNLYINYSENQTILISLKR